jgi:hypothetical protein
MRQNGVRSNVRFPYSKGSKKQTRDDKLDERLGETRGKESTKTQTFASRRHESREATKV